MREQRMPAGGRIADERGPGEASAPPPDLAGRSARMKDVAERAGVSAITVSRALSRPGSVTPATREKIARAIAEVGYVPDHVAGGLKSRRTRMIACIIPGLSVPVFSEFVEGLTETLAQHDYRVLISSSGYSAEGELSALRSLVGHRPEAIILTGISHLEAAVSLIRETNLPVVEVWDWSSTPIDMLVGFSNHAALKQLVSELVAKGRRSIGFLGTEHVTNSRASAREQGYREAIRAAGLSACVMNVSPDIAGGRRGLARLLQADPGLDCVVCVNDFMAVGVMAEAQARGIDVPGQISVTGFADFEISRHWTPSLTTIRVPRHEMGGVAAKQILGRLGRSAPTKSQIDVGYEIVWRASTGE